jgi:hypothetical protein
MGKAEGPTLSLMAKVVPEGEVKSLALEKMQINNFLCRPSKVQSS